MWIKTIDKYTLQPAAGETHRHLLFVDSENKGPVWRFELLRNGLSDNYHLRFWVKDADAMNTLKATLGINNTFPLLDAHSNQDYLGFYTSDQKFICYLANKLYHLQHEMLTHMGIFAQEFSSDFIRAYTDFPAWIKTGELDINQIGSSAGYYNTNHGSIGEIYLAHREEGIFIQFTFKLEVIRDIVLNHVNGLELKYDVHASTKSSLSYTGDEQFILKVINAIETPHELLTPIRRLFEKPATIAPLIRMNPNSSSSSRRITLAEKLEATKNNKNELVIVLRTLSDYLLMPIQSIKDVTAEEIDNACHKILELHNTAAFAMNFYDILKPTAPFLNIDDLKYFLQKKRFQHHFLHKQTDEFKEEHINILLQLAKELEIENIPSVLDQESAESLRKELLVTRGNRSPLSTPVNIALLILSKYWPINAEDYISLKRIKPEYRIFTTLGHQFDSNKLTTYHQSRKNKDNGELRNPVTNVNFEPFDTDHILRLTDQIPKYNQNDPLENLYDLQFTTIEDEIGNKLTTVDLVHGKIDAYRLARLDLASRNQLLILILKHRGTQKGYGENCYYAVNNFSSNLSDLLMRGLSLEQFAQFDSEKQEALCLANPSIWRLIDHGIKADKLFALSADRLKHLCSNLNGNYLKLSQLFNKNQKTVDEMNKEINEWGSQQNAQNSPKI